MDHARQTRKMRRVAMIVAIACLPATALAAGGFYAAIGGIATPQSGTQACQAAQQAALTQCQSVYQQQTQNMQTNMLQPSGLASQSCLGNLLSTSTGMFSNIQNLASGGISGLLSSLGNTMMQQFGSAVCGAVTSQWDNASSQLDQVANLPTTLGEAAAGQASQLGQSAGNAITGPINGATVPQVVPNLPMNIPLAPMAPSGGSGSSTLGNLL